MIEVRLTNTFKTWVADLRDVQARIRIARRIERMEEGNLGDVKFFDGIGEARITFGPGYRLYFVKRGERLIVLLCGGDKGSQRRDIKEAKALAKEIE